MCTVTFVPSGNSVLLTSNRDEKSWRKQALPPKAYQHNDTTLIYPKDAEAGGTWIAVKDNGNAAVLLNGAFEKHISEPPYKKSRGMVFLEIVTEADPTGYFNSICLQGIEPFTLILFCSNNLYEVRWNGTQKFSRHLNKNKAYIWSSATLYDAEIVQKREKWFAEWQSGNPAPTAKDVLLFHQFAGDGDAGNDLHMNRDGIMLTVSVTGISLQKNKALVQYLDLKNNMVYEEQINFSRQLHLTA